jgi:cytochrome P450
MLILDIVNIPWWILFPVFVVLTIVAYVKYKHSFFSRRGIPGPKPAFLTGNITEITKEGMHVFDRKYGKKYGSYFGAFLGNHPTLVICDPEMIQEITSSKFSKFYDRADTVEVPKRWRSTLIYAKGSKWKYVRAISQPSFSPAKIKNMRPILIRCLDEFIDIIEDKVNATSDQVVDMFEIYKRLTMDVICSTAFGIEVNSQRNDDDLFVKNASKVLGTGITNTIMFLNFMFPDRFIREIIMSIAGDWVDNSSMEFLNKTVKEAMKVRQQKSSKEFNDLLKQMMDTLKEEVESDVSEDKSFEQMKKDGMTEEDIVINGIIFLAAGYETTSSLLTFITYSLAAYPEHQERLVDEINEVIGEKDNAFSYDKIMSMEFLDMFVQETLRMYPPGGRFARQPSEDIEIKGLLLKKREDVEFSTHCMHYNPLYWPDPERFDPERFSPEQRDNIVPYSFIPFGAGPRNCIGLKLALVEVKMAIVRLLQYARIEKSAKMKIPPETTTVHVFALLKPVNGMWVKIIKR